jgi:Tlde1 domain
MLRPVACAVVSAAAIAAGLTFGLEGENASHSDRTSWLDQSEASQKLESLSPKARDESRVEIAPVRIASAVAAADVAAEGVVAISARARSTQLLSQALARWNVLILFQASRLDGATTSSSQVAAARINPPDLPKALEVGPPLPTARPAGEKSFPTKLASAAQDVETAAIPQASPQSPSVFGFFEKVFRFPPRASFPAEASGRTAVYDIETHTVYLPGGEVLEAHSGLGEHMDDVRYVQARSRGPTPPNIYTLTLREKPFHGVQAIRLNPVATNNMFGRAGILAHPYMLGPNGQSNGCVSIQNYPKFLEAFLNGQVDRLIVVPRLAATPEIVKASAAVEKRPAAYRPI